MMFIIKGLGSFLMILFRAIGVPLGFLKSKIELVTTEIKNKQKFEKWLKDENKRRKRSIDQM